MNISLLDIENKPINELRESLIDWSIEGRETIVDILMNRYRFSDIERVFDCLSLLQSRVLINTAVYQSTAYDSKDSIVKISVTWDSGVSRHEVIADLERNRIYYRDESDLDIIINQILDTENHTLTASESKLMIIETAKSDLEASKLNLNLNN